MNKHLLALLFAAGVSMPVLASEVWVDINFENKNEMYRIKTDDEENHSIGYLGDLEHYYEKHFIDKIQNHRLIRKVSNGETYNTSSDPLYRQVFDGPAAEADKGRAGNKACYDSRGKLISGENGNVVYRTNSTAFSAGTGKLVPAEEAMQNLLDGECKIEEGKNWYAIPNGSWYQTWNKASGSYDIYYEKSEEKLTSYVEDFYRGETFYKAFDRPLAKVPSKKIFRAVVDGALEEVENGSLKPTLIANYKHDFFVVPEPRNRANEIGCYSWYGNGKGVFTIGDKVRPEIKPFVESKDKYNRFVCCGNDINSFRSLYVLGTDVLKDWLKKYNMPSDKSECTKVACYAMEKTSKTMIYVYSQPDSCIYRFIVDEINEIEVGLPKKYDVDFNVKAMTISNKGSLYIASEVVEKGKPTFDELEDNNIAMETNVVMDVSNKTNLEGFGGGKEEGGAFEARVKMMNMLTTDAECMMVISRAFYQDFYELPFGSDSVEKLDYSIFLGKKYYNAKLSLKHVSMATLDEDMYTLIEVAKRKGNHLGEIVEGAPDFSDSYRKPLNYQIAVKEDL